MIYFDSDMSKSTTHTKYEQGAWWQVDLGEEKNINQIIIYNRTDLEMYWIVWQVFQGLD
jgi:hypothetical protein